MFTQTVNRRELLADVRSYVKSEVYRGTVIGLQWNPGKHKEDKEFGNVTAYITRSDNTHYVLAVRLRLTVYYVQEIEDLLNNIKVYIDKLDKAEKAYREVCEHTFFY